MRCRMARWGLGRVLAGVVFVHTYHYGKHPTMDASPLENGPWLICMSNVFPRFRLVCITHQV